ncbi:TRAP transporter large permease [Phytoactinopolyspora alkaliphila]|uniref:TRAP transporter large permease n=1 Tax=Phytoactinopolyspora alkaliphila TaxID=1783498 RepID=A0A6N9YNL2_9ACTN|nr:TRAP transporter large permease [Phytoactinopolyspora alkaliphila]NED96520.1 TRAP transporter large permease [Phytoactinopolyspora alkaliphila]
MSTEFTVMLIVLVAGFLLRTPIGFTMLSGGMVYMLVGGGDLGNVAQVVMGGFYSKFILLAIPLFIFGAELMNVSRIAERLFTLAHSTVGGMRGGLAQVDVVTSGVFSGMSGSAMADASGTGKMVTKAQVEAGYRPGFACAASAASATLGGVIPPSITMVIYAYLSGTSVGMLFAAGILPGVVIALFLMGLIGFLARRQDFPKPGWQGFGHVGRSFIRAAPALLTVVILLGGIYSGAFTPTEAAGVAALYALILGTAYGLRSPRRIYQVLRTASRQTASTCVVLAGGFIVSYAVASEGVGARIAMGLLEVSTNAIVLLLIVNVVFLLLGMVLDTMVLLLVMIPIVLPALLTAGVDPVHLGVVITFNIMVGLATPPFGMLLFILSNQTRTPLAEIIREILPFIAVLIAALLVLTLWSDISLLLPRLLGYGM